MTLEALRDESQAQAERLYGRLKAVRRLPEDDSPAYARQKRVEMLYEMWREARDTAAQIERYLRRRTS